MTNSAELFLAGARTVIEAIGDEATEAAWDRPSVLEDQLVSGLAGHLARGGVWVVTDYLHAGRPEGPVDFESAGEYFAAFASSASTEQHRAIRDRGAAVAAGGREELLASLMHRLPPLEAELLSSPGDRLISVIGGAVMRLDDYLQTRIVEQAVHLDDLARSIGRTPWLLPEHHLETAIAVGVDVARRRHGSNAVIRALYRKGFAEPTLPAL